MKKIIMLIILVSFNVKAASIKKEISVNGMVCSFCAHGIESKFKDMKEVDSVKVDLDKGKVFLELKEDLKNEKIEETIKNSGYNVEEIK